MSAAIAACGLVFLSKATGMTILLAATLYGFGKTFFWPTMLGVVAEFRAALHASAARIRAFSPDHYGGARTVGRAELPTTLGGLLVHCADHTQRHVGQVVTTAKLILAMRT